MHGSEPQELVGVRCDHCGAHTACVDRHDPRCAYCGSAVSVPLEVQRRAAEIAREVDAAREALLHGAQQLEPERPVFTAFVTLLQLAFVLPLVTWWYQIAAPHQTALSQLQIFAIVLALFGPLMFWLVARGHGIDRQLAKAAKLSFAELVAQTSAAGTTLHLRCPGCGARIGRTTLRGLIITCDHCQTALLAPIELVETNQRRFYRRVLELRGKLARRRDTRGHLTLLGGSVYVVALLWFLSRVVRADPIELGYFTEGLALVALGSCGAWVYWVLSFWGEFWVMACCGLPLLLGPSGAAVLYFLDKSAGP